MATQSLLYVIQSQSTVCSSAGSPHLLLLIKIHLHQLNRNTAALTWTVSHYLLSQIRISSHIVV